VSNGDDVTAFYAALLGGHVLPRSGVAAMERTSESPHYGLGLFVADTPCGRAYGHIGIANGYRTVVYGLRAAVASRSSWSNVDATYVAQSALEEAAEKALCSS
jgi:D-alanyl-D-alanine carboxypeptidase